jgi:sialate O-acetylesterase
VRAKWLIMLALAFAPLVAPGAELPLVSPMFSDNMVLQRGKPNAIWGWSKPGDAIKVEMAGHMAKAVAGPDGRWQAEIDPPSPGGPYTVVIRGPDEHIELREVLVGDVWLCGGQSNMELGLGRTRNGAEEIKSAHHPEIRLYKVDQQVSYSAARAPKGSWEICSPDSIGKYAGGGFSAVAYYFGCRLQEDIRVPVGLIEDCVGGTPVESWMNPSTLRRMGGFDSRLNEIERLRDKGGPAYGSFLMHWLEDYDIGMQGSTWAAPRLNDSDWKTVAVPGGFQELASAPCVCWFRKEIVLPDPLPAGKATILLGAIYKMDTAYINGHWVGASSWAEHPRAYDIPENVLKPGKNMVAVRVFKMKPQDGFAAKPEGLSIELGDHATVPLAGKWKGKLSFDVQPPRALPLDFENYPTMPAVLFMGMIEPVAPLAIKGAIWYQGEANFQRAASYEKLLAGMIGDWRKLFGQGDFPFYIVSLPAFMARRGESAPDGWTALREQQALTARHVKNCGLAVTVDTGEADNIHPQDKKIVGERLALCALGEGYGRKVVYEGPTFASLEHSRGELKIHFSHTDGGLAVEGEKLGEFSIAGADHAWHWADARIEGDTVVVSSPDVPSPVAARYAWQANPLAALYNGAGLPAVPFRTDDWP